MHRHCKETILIQMSKEKLELNIVLYYTVFNELVSNPANGIFTRHHMHVPCVD